MRTLLLTLGLTLAASCGGRADKKASDQTRIVSLSPAVTQVLEQIGAGDEIVGRSSWCQASPEVCSRPDAGSSLTPYLEVIASLRPSMVVMEDAAGNRTEHLGEIAPVQSLPWLSASQVAHSIDRLGELTGHPAEARRLSQRFRDELKQEPPAEGPVMLTLIASDDMGRGPVFYIRPDSLHGAAMHAAGWRNAITAPPEGIPSLTLEGLLELDPSTIVIVSGDDLPAADVDRLKHSLDDLQPLSAPGAGRVYVVHGDGLLTAGPGVLRFAEMLKEGIPTPSSAQNASP